MAKSHGCSGPLNPLQLLSYLIMLLLSTAFYILIVDILPISDLGLLASVLYSLFLLSLSVAGLLATFTDPTDPVILLERRAISQNQPFDSRPYGQICTICSTHVMEMSKHCGQCDRCVDGFDHHCKWLNNCVGSRNYRYFVMLIASLECVVSVQVAFSAYILREISYSDMGKRVNERFWLGSGNLSIYVSLLIAFLVVSITLFIVVGQLIALHIWLRTQGLTTYDYIMRRRQRSKQVTPAVKDIPDLSTLQGEDNSTASGSKSRVVLDRPRKARSDLAFLEDHSDQHAQAFFALATRKYGRKQVVPAENPTPERINPSPAGSIE